MQIDQVKVDSAVKSFNDILRLQYQLELARLKNSRLVISLNDNEYLEYAVKTHWRE